MRKLVSFLFFTIKVFNLVSFCRTKTLLIKKESPRILHHLRVCKCLLYTTLFLCTVASGFWAYKWDKNKSFLNSIVNFYLVLLFRLLFRFVLVPTLYATSPFPFHTFTGVPPTRDVNEIPRSVSYDSKGHRWWLSVSLLIPMDVTYGLCPLISHLPPTPPFGGTFTTLSSVQNFPHSRYIRSVSLGGFVLCVFLSVLHQDRMSLGNPIRPPSLLLTPEITVWNAKGVFLDHSVSSFTGLPSP